MKERMQNFMIGRYGIDQLGIVIAVSSLIVDFVAWLFAFSSLRLLTVLLIILAVYRALSKNLAKRIEENYTFIRIWNNLRIKISSRGRKDVSSKEFKLLICPSCNCTLKVRRGKGKIIVTCPNCSLRFKEHS